MSPDTETNTITVEARSAGSVLPYRVAGTGAGTDTGAGAGARQQSCEVVRNVLTRPDREGDTETIPLEAPVSEH